MQYFTVRALDALNRNLLEVDAPLSQLLPLLDGVEENLRSQRVFDRDDELLKRLVPCSRAVEGITARLIDRPPADLGEAEYSIYYEEGLGEPLRPAQSLSLWFCSTTTGRICSVDLPIQWLFHSAQECLRRDLVNSQRIKDEAALHFDTFLNGQGEVQPTLGGDRTTLLLLLPTQPPPPESDSPDRQGAGKPLIDVRVTGRQSLVMPVKRSWRDYKAKLLGNPQPGDLRILVSRDVLDDLSRVARRSLRRDAEAGGFLLGHVCQDQDQELFVDVSDVVAADAGGSFLSLRYSQEAWRQAFDEINRRFPNEHRVGWYHTHLAGARRRQAVASFKGGDPEAYDLIDIAFFSSDDIALHRSFFSEPWQVALVVDLKRKGVMFYQWKNNQITPCAAYYVYDPASQRGV